MKYLDKSILYLIYFLPLALLTGPFLPDLIVSLVAIFFISTLNYNNKYIYFQSSFFKFFFIFYIYLIFSSLISDLIFFSLKSSLVYIRFIIFSLAIWYLLNTNKIFIKYFTFIFILSFLIAIIAGYYQYSFGETIFGKISRFDRLNLLLSDEQVLGHFLSRLFPLLVGLMLLNFKNKLRYYLLLIFLFISIDTLVYLSGERTSLGLMLLGSVFMLIFINKFRVIRIFSIILSFIIIILLTATNPNIKERNIDHTINQLGLSEGSNKVYIFSKIHENFIITSGKIFLDNKFFGVGPNNFRNYCDDERYEYNKNSCSTHPHNTYIQIAAEIGIFGAIFVIILLASLLIKFFYHLYCKIFKKYSYLSDFQICLIACFLVTFWPLIPSLNFFNNWINIIYYLPVGFFLHSMNRSNEKINLDYKD